MPEALLVTKESLENDIALKPDKRGARKVIVTGLFEKTERLATHVVWGPPDSPGQKCPVQVMQDTEVAVFNHHAAQVCTFIAPVPRCTWFSKVPWGSRSRVRAIRLAPGT